MLLNLSDTERVHVFMKASVIVVERSPMLHFENPILHMCDAFRPSPDKFGLMYTEISDGEIRKRMRHCKNQMELMQLQSQLSSFGKSRKSKAPRGKRNR